jgi:hypothetical protein
MNDNAQLNTVVSRFTRGQTLGSALSVHAQHQQGRLGRYSWQWRMPIRNNCSDVNHHLRVQRSLEFYRNLPSVPLP